MKKWIMLFLCAGITYTFAEAQQFSIGLRAGVATSSYWTMQDGSGGNRLLALPHMGVLLAYPVTERLTLQAELNFAPKGDAWYFDYKSGRREAIRDVYRYLEIPVLAKFRFVEQFVNVYGIGGVYVAHALSNHYTEDDRDYEVAFAKGDFGLQLGAGASLPLGPGNAFAEIRLAPGLKNLDVFGDGTVTRLKSFGFSIGWMLQLP